MAAGVTTNGAVGARIGSIGAAICVGAVRRFMAVASPAIAAASAAAIAAARTSLLGRMAAGASRAAQALAARTSLLGRMAAGVSRAALALVAKTSQAAISAPAWAEDRDLRLIAHRTEEGLAAAPRASLPAARASAADIKPLAAGAAEAGVPPLGAAARPAALPAGALVA